MKLKAEASEPEIIVGTARGILILLMCVVYFPFGLVQEAFRPDNEILPEYMGSVRGRRVRLTAVLVLLLAITVTFTIWAQSR